MQSRKLFGTNLLVDQFLSQLTKVEDIDGGWAAKYFDDKRNEYWLMYVIDDNGFFRNLMCISPAPTTEELIDIALNTSYSDEVSAASIRLRVEEQTQNKEYRRMLIDRLMLIDYKKIDHAEAERVRTVIQASELADRVNRRAVLRKHYSEVQKDSDFFKFVADQADDILETLNTI